MDKFLAFLAALESVAASLVNVEVLPQEVRDAAAKVVAASEAVKAEIAHPDFNRAVEYVKHHGNLPGTPESRGER